MGIMVYSLLWVLQCRIYIINSRKHQGSGFRVYLLPVGFRVQCSGFAQGLGFRGLGMGFGVWSLAARFQGVRAGACLQLTFGHQNRPF